MLDAKFKKLLPDEALYRTLIEHMNEAVWVGDKNERTVYANPKFCELLEYSLPEMMGRESYDFWDEASGDRVRQVNSTHRKHGIASSYEGILASKSGQKIPVLLSGASLPGGGTIGIMTDLRELKKKESVYKKLVEHMNEAVWMGDKNERTIYANPKFCELVEYPLEELIGKKSYDFWDETSQPRVREINLTKRKKGISSSYEGTLVSKSGKKIPVLLSGTPLPEGGTIGILTDLTVLKQKETAEKVLNSAIQYATDAIIIFDKNGTISSWNKGAKIIFGYKKEEMMGLSLERVFPSEKIKDVLERSKIVYNVELTGRHKNQQPINVSATLTPIFSDDKKDTTFCLLIARDITTQTKFEEELMVKYQKMKEAYNKFGVLRRQMDYVFEMLDLLRTGHHAKAMADFIVSSIIMLTRVDACVLRKYQAKKDALELISAFGVGDDWHGKATLKYKNSLLAKAYALKAPLKIIDFLKEPRFQSKHLAKKNNLSSLLLIPLQYKGALVGSLSLYVGPNKKLEIFDNEFIEEYAKLIEIVVGTMAEG